MKKLPTRISKTIKALTSTTIPSKAKVQMKVSVQKARYPKDLVFVVILGGDYVDDTVAELILDWPLDQVEITFKSCNLLNAFS